MPGEADGLSGPGVGSCPDRDVLDTEERRFRHPSVALVSSGNLETELNGLLDAFPQLLVGLGLGVAAGERGDRRDEIAILPAADNRFECYRVRFHTYASYCPGAVRSTQAYRSPDCCESHSLPIFLLGNMLSCMYV